MQLEILNRTPGNTRLILLVAGWSTTPDFYRSIRRSGWDVALIHDYSSLQLSRKTVRELCERYATVYLYAWSMGVFAACYSELLPLVTEAFALNGTPAPVDDYKGIPLRIFDGTYNGLDDRSLRKFHRRMFGSAEEFSKWSDILSSGPGAEVLKTQLEQIRRGASTSYRVGKWSKAFASDSDCIFPYQAQLKAWREAMVPVETLHGSSHFVDLNTIIGRTTVNLEKVKSKFSSAAGTYDDNAIAQREAIGILMKLIDSMKPTPGGNALEIGHGTGLFTQEYLSVLKPDSLTLVDLYESAALNLARSETYITGDAESFMERMDEQESYNFILTTSTIQWFTNLHRFFVNCHRHLRPGGLLAFSTFGRLNLHELNGVRTSPIKYFSSSEIMDMLKPEFVSISMEEKAIRLSFPSIRSMLMHLKLTGVGGGIDPNESNVSASGLIRKYSEKIKPQEDGRFVLTYDVICVVARK